MQQTKVKEVMTAHPTFINPETTLQYAAQKMKQIDCGVLPVGTEDKLEGIITDRDIVLRAVSEGKDPANATAKEYMSDQVYTCNENNTLKEAAELMAKYNVNRLVVDNEDGKVTGILSLGCILRKDNNSAEIVKIVEHIREKKAA